MEGVWEKGKELFDKIPQRLYLPVALGVVGVILFAYGIWSMVGQPQEAVAQPQTAALTPPKVLGTSQSDIKVDIEGAVQNPGVYSLPKDTRVQDGLIAAGGLSSNADRNYVTKHINLATKLVDGAKLYFPSQEESLGSGEETIGQDSGITIGDTQSGIISINTATEAELDSLPGVGPVTAEKIITNRPYEALEDLVTKKAVTQKVFDKIKDKISL